MARDCGRILIVDADARFRAFVSRLFRGAGYSVEDTGRGEEGLAAARKKRPGLVLLDVGLPDLSGFEVCLQLRDEFGDDVPIVFLSGERTTPVDRAAGFHVGGDDYLVKPVDRDELLARARRLISRSHRERLGRPDSVDGSLTQRELQVLTLLAEGLGSKTIAQELVISPKTVGSHVQRILAKLGAHSRAEAIAIAYRDGFVASPPSNEDDDAEVGAHLSAIAV